ncbi:MAG: DNA glycosylase AlkZ-like family protein [Isosphaeraceae bacterium]
MRGTLHLLDARDARWLVSSVAPSAITRGRRRREELGLEPGMLARALDDMRAILGRAGPLNRRELAERLAAKGLPIDAGGQAPIHLIAYAALEGVLCLGPERDGVNAALRHLDAGNLLHACLVIGVQGSGLRGRAKGHHLFADGLDVLGQGRVELVGVDCHLTRKAVAAAAGGNSLAVGADYHAVDPSRQRRKLADQVGVVADHTRRPAKDPVQLGLAIGAADDNLIPLGVSGHGREPPLERSGGDRGDIVDEPLRRHLGQLRRHVAADRDQIRSVDGEDRVLGPITMSTQEEHLLTRPGIDRPDRVVGTAEGDPGPIGRPARSINRVKCDRDRKAELPLGHVPDLDLAHP